MPATTLSELRAHKERLIAESDFHREQLMRAGARLSERRAAAAWAFSGPGRWLLLGGAALGGFLLIRHWRRVLVLLPSLVSAARLLPR